jgi:hypothetical protein
MRRFQRPFALLIASLLLVASTASGGAASGSRHLTDGVSRAPSPASAGTSTGAATTADRATNPKANQAGSAAAAVAGGAAAQGSTAAQGGAAAQVKVATVAANDADYQQCGRVFPDPHAYWPGSQTPGRSPWAKGNQVCASTDFLQYTQMIDGLTYLQKLFPKFVQFYQLERDFGNGSDCATSTNPADLCSAGLPNTGAASGRSPQDLFMVRVTDERVPDRGKKYFVFPLSIHGIERAGAEAGVRAAEDFATWGFCEAVANGSLAAKPIVSCGNEGAIPHPLLEAQSGKSITAGNALRRSAVYFVFPNPDGWKRGDMTNTIRYYQRYNGNGVDLNRDWPTLGYTFKPYTPWSEPETRSIGRVLKAIRPKWDGGIDLHGQLIDRAFSFTLMGASQRDFAKNQRILQTVKGAWSDAEQRLAWSSQIKPNTAPDQCSSTLDPPNCDERMYGVQWGTVWDTIAYTVTGDFGGWIDSPMGLNGDGIDNEMSVSHLINCGLGSCYLHEFEQLHVDGNKSLVYSMINFSFKKEDTRFRAPGRVAYVYDPTMVQHASTPVAINDDWKRLPHQAGITNITLGPDNGWLYEFDVNGPEQGVYNGGIEGKVTLTNIGGVSTNDIVQTVLEMHNPDGEGAGEVEGCGAAGGNWSEINRYFGQGAGYFAAGQAVHGNMVLPGKYRICVLGTVTEAAAGLARLEISFTREKAWEDPGQRAYKVSNMRFFRDLQSHMKRGQLVKVDARDVLSEKVQLLDFDSVVIADDPWPFAKDGKKHDADKRIALWAEELQEYVKGGGNLVLTDGAVRALAPLGVVAADKIGTSKVYAGYVGFTADAGNTATYEDPLARNINQPGAAEGPGHRHQTYEPVPIGFAIQDDAGNDLDTAPAWWVDQAAWETATGRTAGTTGDSRTSLGEVAMGKGVVRIIGALLPMPSDAYYHPFGISNYALTYTGYQLLNNALDWKHK